MPDIQEVGVELKNGSSVMSMGEGPSEKSKTHMSELIDKQVILIDETTSPKSDENIQYIQV